MISTFDLSAEGPRSEGSRPGATTRSDPVEHEGFIFDTKSDINPAEHFQKWR
jgi:hypothetical protein